jgi:hypothetical protein
MHVDMRTNQVVGVPVRPSRETREPLRLVVGGRALYAIDGDRNTVLRLDPYTARILARRRIARDTPLTGAVVAGTLWVAVQPFGKDRTG